LLAALRPHERVLVLLQLLGGQQRVETRTKLSRGGLITRRFFRSSTPDTGSLSRPPIWILSGRAIRSRMPWRFRRMLRSVPLE
jgi:hypothetical protein